VGSKVVLANDKANPAAGEMYPMANDVNPPLGVKRLVMPSVGDKIKFGCREWEVSGVEAVDCDYDSSYQFRVNLILRDHTGKPVNFATNIPNLCLD
jgi:hypothetical protein